jgi:hypothetical protein
MQTIFHQQFLEGVIEPNKKPFDTVAKNYWLKVYRFKSKSLYTKSKGIIAIDHCLDETYHRRLAECKLPHITNEDIADVIQERNENDQFPISFITDEDCTEIDPTFVINNDWKPTIINTDEDDEETKLAKSDQQAIIDYTYDLLTNETTKMNSIKMILCGSPGVGKTYLLNLLCCLLRSKGHTEAVFTCISSSRARDIKGTYLHQLFRFGEINSFFYNTALGWYNANKSVEFCTVKMWKTIEKDPIYRMKLMR